jgi:hypothetical protein
MSNYNVFHAAQIRKFHANFSDDSFIRAVARVQGIT